MNEKDNFNVVVLFVPHLTAGARGGKVRIAYFRGGLGRKRREENRWIFLDAYTSWCGPCKVMAEQVFTLAKAGVFFNSRFVNVKYDMEKGKAQSWQKTGIGAYPTFVLIRPDGVVHDKLVGGMDVDGIIQRWNIP